MFWRKRRPEPIDYANMTSAIMYGRGPFPTIQLHEDKMYSPCLDCRCWHPLTLDHQQRIIFQEQEP